MALSFLSISRIFFFCFFFIENWTSRIFAWLSERRQILPKCQNLVWGLFQLVNKWLSIVYSGAREKSNNCFNSIQFSGFIIRTASLLLVLNKSHTLTVGQQWCSGLKDTMLTQIFFFFIFSAWVLYLSLLGSHLSPRP